MVISWTASRCTWSTCPEKVLISSTDKVYSIQTTRGSNIPFTGCFEDSKSYRGLVQEKSNDQWNWDYKWEESWFKDLISSFGTDWCWCFPKFPNTFMYEHRIGHEMDHLSCLLRKISSNYLKMRLKTFGKKYSEMVVHKNEPSLRHQLTKTILFHH